MRFKSKFLIVFVLIFVLVFGSVFSVNASGFLSEDSVSGIVPGQRVAYASGRFLYGDSDYDFDYSVTVNSVSGDSPVFSISVLSHPKSVDSNCQLYTYFVSRSSFSINYTYIINSDYSPDVTNKTLDATSSLSGGWYVANASPNHSVCMGLGSSVSAYILLDLTSVDYSSSTDFYDGVPFVSPKANMVFGLYNGNLDGIDITCDTGIFDYTSSSFDVSLGYLSNLKRSDLCIGIGKTGGNIIGLDSTFSDGLGAKDYKTTFTWNVVNSDWDSSYKVAFYRKMHLVKSSLFNNSSDIVASSGLVYVGSTYYSDATYSYMASAAGKNEFTDFVSKYSGNYDYKYDDYIVIYRETDSGTQRGYWNVIPTSVKDASYGVTDGNGNYTSVGELPVDGIVSGGETLEDAENGKDYYEEIASGSKSPFGIFQPIIDFFESIPKFFLLLSSYMESTLTSVGDLPSIIGQFFTFLPEPVIGCISLGIVAIVFLRIFGR